MNFTPMTVGRPVWLARTTYYYYYYISLSPSTSPSVRLIILEGRSNDNYTNPPAPPTPAYSPLNFAWWSRAKLSSENYNSKILLLDKTKVFCTLTHRTDFVQKISIYLFIILSRRISSDSHYFLLNFKNISTRMWLPGWWWWGCNYFREQKHFVDCVQQQSCV